MSRYLPLLLESSLLLVSWNVPDMPQSSQPFHFVLIIHAHQPAGNFEHVFEECYKNSYLEFLELLEKHPTIRAAIHYSGPLLLWIEKHHPGYFVRLRQLVASGQIELIGGGFYEPILISIPEPDRTSSSRAWPITLKNISPNARRDAGSPNASGSRNFLQRLLPPMSVTPWWTICPFLPPDSSRKSSIGPYIAEDRGKTVWLFPGLKELRYLIPFRKVEESIDLFRKAAEVASGRRGGLRRRHGKVRRVARHSQALLLRRLAGKFFNALEENSSWLKIIHARRIHRRRTFLSAALIFPRPLTPK